MNDDRVGPAGGKVRHVAVGLDDHEVDLQGQAGDRAQSLDDRLAETEVGHEDPIHHVEVDAIGAGLLDGPHLVAQPQEIGRQDGWGELDHAGGGARPAYGRLVM